MTRKAWMGIVLPVWVLVSFALAQVLVGIVIGLLNTVGTPLGSVNPAVLNTGISALIYILTLVVVIGLPWWIKRYRTSKEDLGLKELPRWLDLLLAPAGFLIYVLLSALFIYLAMQYLTFIDFDQTQETGFNLLTQQYQFALAFLTLVIIAPVSEEILFRGYLFGKLRKHVPLWIAILITSLLFAFVHGAWNVGIDVFALSIVLCLLRVVSKSLWPSIVLHMIKNSIAFYFLFINPLALVTLGG